MSQNLTINRLKTRPAAYEIINGSTVIASLTPKFSSAIAAKVEKPSNKWEFKYNFFRNNIAVKPIHNSNNELIFKMNLLNSKGTIKLGEKLYYFKKTSLWRPNYVWLEEEKEVIKYMTKNFWNLKGRIQLADHVDINDNYILLIMLGIYVIQDNMRAG